MSKGVSFLDINQPHLELEDEITAVFKEALGTGRFIGGHMVEDFERDFAKFCDAKYCVGVGSGTDALRFALIAAGVKRGDIVITVPNTFIATTEAISQVGATPAFVDIDPKTYNMDTNKLEDYLKKCFLPHASCHTPQPKAVLPVHLYGQMADMDAILEIAEKYKLITIEDACQAHGSDYFSQKENHWRKAGSMGQSAAFSFYPGKNLGAFGEGGAVTTNDEEIAQKIRMIRDHGQIKKYYHDMEGYNGRLDAIQAGILGIKLKHLPEWNEKRRQNAARYSKLLSGIKNIILPEESEQTKSVYHLYVIHMEERKGLQKYLANNNIASGLHYPVPLHLQKAYAHLEYKEGDFPVAEKSASRLLSLPMYPDLKEEQQIQVVERIKEFVSNQEG